MPIDASIALGVKPVQLPDPVNQLARVLQVQGLQSQQQVNGLKMDEYRRGLERKNKMQEILGQEYAKPEERENALLRGGFVDEATKLSKERVDRVKSEAETEAKLVETANKRIDSWGNAMGFVRQNPTPENAVAAVRHLVTMGIIPKEQAQSALSGISSDPQSIAQWATQGFQTALSAKDQLAKMQTSNIGGQTITQSIDPLTGRTTTTGAVQNTQSPDAQLQAQTSTANNQRSVNASMANAGATREIANATRYAANAQRDQNTEMKLGDDYRTQSKNFKETADAYKQITSVLDKATTSPAATLAGATKFMKMIDPGSVVRESELGMALAATGVFDRAANYMNTLRLGKVLNPKQAADFKNITRQIMGAASEQQKLVDKHFSDVAKGYGLRPDMVIQDFGQNAATPAAVPAASPTQFRVLGVEK